MYLYFSAKSEYWKVVLYITVHDLNTGRSLIKLYVSNHRLLNVFDGTTFSYISDYSVGRLFFLKGPVVCLAPS